MDNGFLKELYTKFSLEITDPELSGKCSLPLLLHLDDRWEKSRTRVLVVGQETLAWQFIKGKDGWEQDSVSTYAEFAARRQGGADLVGALMDDYERFLEGREHKNSPFWRAFGELRTMPGTSILWTNLVRCSVDNGSVIRNCTKAQLDHLLKAQRGLLVEEIQLLQPTAVVFFTGPNYDRILCNEFPDARFHAVQGHQERQFCRVQANGLPARSFRLYHPGYLVRSGRRNWIDKLKQLIAE